jgi:hypothetical protein
LPFAFADCKVPPIEQIALEDEMGNGLALSFRVDKIAKGNPEVAEAIKAFEAASKAAKEARLAAQTALANTPEGRLLSDASTGHAAPQLVVERFGSLVIRVRHHRIAREPDTSIAPQTLNALLTGKLLTDDEKRALLQRQGIRFADPPAHASADEADLAIADFDDEIPF